MPREILVNVDTRETRVAVIESGKLVELHVEREQRIVGSLYKCRIANVLAGMDAAFVDMGLDRNAFLFAGDILPEASDELPTPRRDSGRHGGIKDALKERQELLVQVVKGPRGSKGARVSTRISLPGRYLVLMPDADNMGVSRKIESESERDRLKNIVERMRPAGFGLIVRTEAEERGEADIARDLEFLLRMWAQIGEKAEKTHAPGLVHQELSLVYKTVRDLFGSDTNRMIIDSPIDYEKALELVELLSPKMAPKLLLHDESRPIFEKYGVESEIEGLLRRKVYLKSGGHLSIDATEALTTIDVNTGRFVGSTRLADTIVRTNLDAVVEIARQLRLRDIGGMIVLDFIDMSSIKDRQKVVSALEKELQRDRTRAKICHISPLGLVEMTRKRTGEAVTEFITDVCPHCQGRGRIESAESVSIRIERDLRKLASEKNDEAFLVTANPEVAFFLIGSGGEAIDEIERGLRRAVFVRADESLHVENYQVKPGDMRGLERYTLPLKQGQVVECTIISSRFSETPWANAWADGYLIEMENGGGRIGARAGIRLTKIGRSCAFGDVITEPSKRGTASSR